MPNTINILPHSTPAPEATYRAYALQPGAETLLAEGISNEKGECKLTYEWSGGKVLHVQVRAFSFEGAPLGASEVVYNAKEAEQVRIKISTPPAPKEYEGILAVLGRMIPEGYALSMEESEMVEKSGESLNGSIPKAYRALLTKPRLENIIRSRELSAETGLPESICYAILYGSGKNWTAQALLAETDVKLTEWINKAVADNIIPPPEEPAATHFDSARLAMGLQVWQECFGILRSKTNGRPLYSYTVHLRDTANGRELGFDVTNSLGRFVMRYPVSSTKTVNVLKTGIQLEISISPPGGEVIHKETIRLKPGQQEYGDIQVPEVIAKSKITGVPARAKSPGTPTFLAKYLSAPGAPALSRSLETPESQSWKKATSSRSYLSDLLDYTLKYLRQSSGGATPTALTLPQLSALLYQPFEVLLNSNAAAEQPDRQIRLCIEGLRALLGNRPLGDGSKEAGLASAEAAWRTMAYESLLVNLGVSSESMSGLGTADEATRKALATRLGVAPEKVTSFYKLTNALTDVWLEETFGLRETYWNGLSTGTKTGDTNKQISRWQLEGIEWYKTTDAEGKVYLRLTKPAGSTYLVEVFRDAARSVLLASGSISTAQGVVELTPYADGGVRGFFGLNYTNGGATISISVIPTLLFCRYQLAYARWQAFYQPDDTEGLEFLNELYQNTTSTLENAIEKTEKNSLVALRDALATAIGQPLRQLSERLLLDCEFDASFQTSRTTQAITTLQQLLSGLRTGMLQDTFPGLQFTAPTFDEEWTWLSTYDNWRSAILVFLYPENALDPTLRRWQTPAFRSVVEQLRGDRLLNEKTVHGVLRAYTNYFRDINKLEIASVCYLKQFAIANGQVYWSEFGSMNETGFDMRPWEKVPGFEEYSVGKIIGTVLYRQKNGTSQIYLCCLVESGSRPISENEPVVIETKKLAYTVFETEENKWSSEAKILFDLGHDNTIVVEQRLDDTEPLHFVVQRASGDIFSRRLNEEGIDWEEADWKKIEISHVKWIHALVKSMGKSRLLYTRTNFRPAIVSFTISDLDKTPQSLTYVYIGEGITFGVFQESDDRMWRFGEDGYGRRTYNSLEIPATGNFIVGASLDMPVGMTKVAVHGGVSVVMVQSGNNPLGLTKGFRLSYANTSGQKGQFQAIFAKKDNNTLELRSPQRLCPVDVSYFNLGPGTLVESRRQKIEAAFSANADAPAEVIQYLWEAYYFLPVYIAQQLKRSHAYAQALDYFRLIYDYGLPVAERKIFYGLQQEENLPESFERPAAWLSDPLNPHHIAATRKQAYYRYTLLALTRLCLQAADAEFVRDTAESLASARAWYAQALELLQSPELQQGQANWGLLFTVPQNPVADMLAFYAEVSLYKLHTGRNIAGDEREAPLLEQEMANNAALQGFDGYRQTILPASGVQRPTAYRFVVLLERAKQLAGMAQQIEAAFLSALEKLDAERMQLLNAKNELQTAKATVRLQDLRVKEARDGVKMAEMQNARSKFQWQHFQALLNEDLIDLERKYLRLIKPNALEGLLGDFSSNTGGLLEYLPGIGSFLSSSRSKQAQFVETLANFERRRQEWRFQTDLSKYDIQISTQQIRLAQDQVQIVGQERNIAALRSDQAASVANFLATKFTNAELYDFMSDVLEGVYSFFLQQATATAQMAAMQLAFERQEPVPAVVLADYWTPPSRDNGTADEKIDRRGITGSARLLQDIQRLDQIAFQTDQRKLQLSKTLSLAQLSPAEFQQFRETGVFPFHIPIEAFDRDFPGHYLRLIRQVRVSVIALIPTVEGIRATLLHNGISRVVLSDNGRFSETIIRRPPESIAFTAPLNANGLFEMQPDNGKLLPFESMGVDGFWELQLPKAANAFDYNTIADVLITIEYTALNNSDYRRQVIAGLDRKSTGDRAFSFRREFPDQWYDLNHAEQSTEPMTVQFETLGSDFPANLEQLKLKHVVLYFARKDGFTKEINIKYLRFQPQSGAWLGGTTDQNLITANGILSTRTGSFSNWDSFRGKLPFGQWSLALKDSPELRQLFRDEQISDVLFVLSFEGESAEWVG
jgi:hypothetical protein